MRRRFNFTSAIGILITVAGLAVEAIQSVIAEKEEQKYIQDCVKEEVKNYLEGGDNSEEDEEPEEEP